MSERHSLRNNLLLALATFVLFAGLLEGAARVAIYWRYGSAGHGRWWELAYEPYLLFKWNERMHQPFAPKGERYRVLLLGGSTAGMMPPAILEEAYAAASGREVEVINLAQGGYIASQDVVMLALYGMQLEPDLIVTLDGYNDIVNGSKTGNPSLHYWNGYVETAVDHPLLNALFAVVRHSQLVNALTKLRERRSEGNAFADAALAEAIVANFEARLASVAAMAKGVGAEYVPVLQPYLQLRDSLTPREQGLDMGRADQRDFVIAELALMDRRLAQRFAGDGAWYVDARNVFDAAEGECFEDEVHLTEHGNRVLAAWIARRAQEQGFAFRRAAPAALRAAAPSAATEGAAARPAEPARPAVAN